jgi:hypothetical protein
MMGARHQGSLRRVRSLICALVLPGAAETCVMADASALMPAGIAACLIRSAAAVVRDAFQQRYTARHGRVADRTLFHWIPPMWPGAAHSGV